jgi:hypothetical protein
MDRDRVVLIERHRIGLVLADRERRVGAQGRQREDGEPAIQPVVDADVPGSGAAEVYGREGMERDHHRQDVPPHTRFHELMDRVLIRPVERCRARRLLTVREREIAGHVDVLAASAERRGDLERAVAVDDQSRIAGQYQRGIEDAREAAAERCGADVPCDMPQAVRWRQAEIAQPARDARAGVITGENGAAAAVRVHELEGGRLVRCDPAVRLHRYHSPPCPRLWLARRRCPAVASTRVSVPS